MADECAHNNGGCWQGDYAVNGGWKKTHFSACQDQISSIKVPRPQRPPFKSSSSCENASNQVNLEI